jgi:hypothetical protein
MGQKLERFIPVIAAILFIFITILALPSASAQATVSLQEQLAAQYKLAKMGADSSGTSVIEEGTVLAVQKGGIVGVPYKAVTVRTATYKDGTVHASDVAHNATAQKVSKLFCGLHKCPTTPDAASDENATKLFKVGDKVYATKIDVNTSKDQVTMSIVACDSCNKTDPTTYNKANVVFQFASGALAKASAGDVEDTIGQLLAISNDDSQQVQGDQQQGNQQQGGQQQGQGGGQQAQQQQQPQSIQMGMTMDQVTAALGQPEKMVNLGPKQLYIYKDMKITFINGRVADVN